MFRKETGFQETEIGKLPEGWRIKRLGEVAIVRSGFSERRRDERSRVIHLRPDNINNETDKIIFNDIVYIPESSKIEKYLLEHLDIVLVNTNGSINHIGKVGIIDFSLDKKITFSNHLTAIRIVSKDINPYYVYYFLSLLHLKGYYKKLVKNQAGKWNLNLSTIRDLLIPIPPLEEQKRIVDILSMIDSGIESVDRAIAKLDRMKKALLNELLTGRIRVREESDKLMFYRETEFQDTEIGEIPKDWKLVKLSNIVEDIYYGITAKAVEHKTGLKILRTTDIKDYNVDWDSLPFCEITEKRGNIQRFLLKKGDIIIARAGTTGVCVLVEKDFEDVIFGSYLIKIRLNKNVYPRFIYYFCQSHSYWNQITSGQAGSTIKNINIPLLKSLNVPLPSSVKEQTAVTEILSTVDKAIELYRREKERLLRLKRGLMSVLLTGRVRVVSDVRDVGVVV
jgi:type I restriction enzyme S subunit